MKKETQEKQILHALSQGGTLTPIEALNLYGCLRLGARIYDLKNKGHNIINIWKTLSDGTRVAQYKLIK